MDSPAAEELLVDARYGALERLYLHLKAPFGAFGVLQGGTYRTSLPMMPYATAWGLVLSAAGIDVSQQLDEGHGPGLPPLRLALGGPSDGKPFERHQLVQHLHSYPVGNSGAAPKDPKKRAEWLAAGNLDREGMCHGAKYWITLGTVEFLGPIEILIGLEAPAVIVAAVQAGLAGELPRRGHLYCGSSRFLLERLDLYEAPPGPFCWYAPPAPGVVPRGACALPVCLDRRAPHRDEVARVAPQPPSTQPPADAWIWTPRAPVRSVRAAA